MGPARARLVRDTVGSLAVLGIVALAAFGLPLIDRWMPDSRPVAAGEPYPVGGGVSVVPPPGAVLVPSRTRPGAERGTALFQVDGTPPRRNGSAQGVRVAVVVAPYRGDLSAATERLRRKISRTGSAVTGAEEPVRTGHDVDGRRGGYVSAGRVGAYAALVADGHAVELTASGTEAGLRDVDLDTMIRSITFAAGRGP
jgi:hypothetical protein